MPDGFSARLSEAIHHFLDHGYLSQGELDYWLRILKEAAERELPGDETLRRQMRESLEDRYQSFVERGQITKLVPRVQRYTIDKVKPHLRAELDRRILASVDLIKLNRKAAVEKTLQRFSGWSTSIPAGGGVSEESFREAKASIGKSIKQVRFEERRVAIDQGHKLIANVADIVAREAGAIAGEWNSHWRQPGYDYREDHKERDERIYAIRGNWAIKAGLMKVGSAGYLDDITQAGQEPLCRCFVRYITTPDQLPDDMLTRKGQEAFASTKKA